ncbi:hypothetical protein GGQ95_000271 [Anoxybacillus rupiensis]|nr:hypothetical protein [Anoxybacillus rupiensis]
MKTKMFTSNSKVYTIFLIGRAKGWRTSYVGAMEEKAVNEGEYWLSFSMFI